MSAEGDRVHLYSRPRCGCGETIEPGTLQEAAGRDIGCCSLHGEVTVHWNDEQVTPTGQPTPTADEGADR